MTTSQRRYLVATAPVTGAAIMIIEILGAKMLAPYIGTSHFVWTAQIAVTMIALAAGYALGGFIADRAAPRGGGASQPLASGNPKSAIRNPQSGGGGSATALYLCVLGAALALVLGTLVREPVALACLQLGLRAGSFLAATILFFVPLCLLATVPPILVRNLAAGMDSIGRTVGRLSAISTIGSVLGTLAIGYVLIPNFSNTTNMLATAAVLALVALGYLLTWRAIKPGASVFIVFAILAIGVPAFLQGALRIPPGRFTEIHRANSNYGLLQVLDSKEEPLRFYLNDLLVQNIYIPRTRQSAAEFTHMLHGLARAYTPQIRDVLCIGMGVGIVPMQFAAEGAQVDIVEINPGVVPLAEKFFDFDRARIRTLAINDGRPWLASGNTQYDTIILDAFLGDAPPSHLMTREAFAEMKRHLRPGGTLVINSFGTLEAGKVFFTASLEKTLAAVFATVRLHTLDDGNNYYVATDRSDARPLRAFDISKVPPHLRDGVAATFGSIRTAVNSPGAIVLTDDYNPVEYHDARNREHTRRTLALTLLAGQEE